jgi:hypothetical protein
VDRRDDEREVRERKESTWVEAGVVGETLGERRCGRAWSKREHTFPSVAFLWGRARSGSELELNRLNSGDGRARRTDGDSIESERLIKDILTHHLVGVTRGSLL